MSESLLTVDEQEFELETGASPVAEETTPVVPELPEGPTFRDLDLSDALVRAVESSGYVTPTPIQAATIPLLLAGRDVLGQAQTGTGKTAAFALPMLHRIDLQTQQPQVLVLTPTRELAIQVAESFERYAVEMGRLRVAAIYGGQDYMVQFRQLDRGVQVVVGTPGRVMDHMRRGSLQLGGLKGLVLDEADEMLKMGFAEDVEWILSQVPEQRQIALFSATLPSSIRRIAQQHLREPAEITIKQRTATAETVRQRYVIAAPHQKEAALARILEAEPIDGVIIFVKTRSTTEPLAEFLTRSGYKVAAINGEIAQKQRERIVESLRAGDLDILVATDVAARGLDVQRISHVINYDLPFDSEVYVHRIGRTGRAGRSGEAILFVHPRDRRRLKNLEHATRQPIEPMELPSNRAINKRRVLKFHEQMTETLTSAQMDEFSSIVEQFRRENDLPLEQIAAALAVMANQGRSLLMKDDFKQASFAAQHSDDRRSFDRRPNDRRSNDRRPGDRNSNDRNSHDRRPNDRRGSDRRFEGGRPQRDDARDASRGPRDAGPRKRSREAMETYRIEVGHSHQVKPGNIVGAIANSAGLESSMIGRIAIFDDYSTVDLPQGMPRDIFNALKKTWVAGRQLQISRLAAKR